MSMGRPTQFLDIAPWSMKGKDNQHFASRICKSGSFKLSNMGIAAGRSHMKPSNTGVQMTKYERAFSLWFKMKKLKKLDYTTKMF